MKNYAKDKKNNNTHEKKILEKWNKKNLKQSKRMSRFELFILKIVVTIKILNYFIFYFNR